MANVSQTEGREADIVKLFDLKMEDRDSPPALIFHGVRGQNYQEGDCPSWYNPQEIWQIVRYLQKCYSIKLTEDDVGVITPYKKQVHPGQKYLMFLLCKPVAKKSYYLCFF